MSIAQNTVTQVISAVCVTAALVAGGFVGSFTSTDTPANAEVVMSITPVSIDSCTMCSGTSGSGGNVPSNR